ncbi:YajG family lipoprotein [Candidatus Igneacidithiobacillus taiwanensis]|uniref:YajG family lipoprotein n=1 Tax=Candidatus Igneacidithiobacillus taiwanensis TaxID=1945924 RepID=UPI0028966D42|nr:YajG family lipoprotein [Candidatus Igneacidithiobacillus taiwanensis]MCE5359803.1 hypothetical protein [Acidithiobacillus sp.]
MNTKMTKSGLKVAGLVAAFALTGCAFVPDEVHPTYKAPAGMTKVAGAAQVSVAVDVINDRKDKNFIGYTKNGYGFKTSDVYMNIQKDLTRALNSALQIMGYNVQKNGAAHLVVHVKKFRMHENMHLTYISHYGKTAVTVSVKNGKGNTLFQKNVETSFKTSTPGLLSLSSNRHSASEAMLNKTVNAIVTQPGFNKALFEAAGVTQVTGATVFNNP